MKKIVWLSLLFAACVWFAVRDFVPFLSDAQENLDGAAAVDLHDPDQVIEALSRDIERHAADLQPEGRLAETYQRRGSFRLLKHEPQQALEDFDAALRLNPGDLTAKFGRAACYRELGDAERADTELRQAGTIELSDAIPGLKWFASLVTGVAEILSTPAGAWLLVAAAWALLVMVNAAAGWGATVESSGSFSRLASVAAGLALLEVLPLGVRAALAACQTAAQLNLWLAAGVTGLSLVATIPMLQPPVRLRGTAAKLPLVDDPAFLERVAQLARQMNVPVPLVRLWPSISGSQQAQAFAGTLQAPQLVVTDGILQRLSPAERDAVVAHELGHIANGSLWLYAAVIPVTCAAAIAVGAFFPMSIAVPFGFALSVGLRRLVSRPLELDADRRAARAIGFRDTAAALTKVHAVQFLGNSGLLPLLIYATATHPSRDERLWSLAAAAPAGELFEKAPCTTTISLHRVAARAAFSVWLLVLCGTLAAAACALPIWFLAAPLWIAGLTPAALLGLAHWRQVSVAQSRLGHTRLRTIVLVIALLACPILACFPEVFELLAAPLGWMEESEYFLIYPLVLAGAWLAGEVWMKRWQETRRLRGEVAVAYQVHDFSRVLEIGKSAPTVVARDPLLRYNIAFARAVCGDSPAAIAELDQLWRDKPGFPITAITLGVLLLDADQPERALDVARSVAACLPDDSATHLLVARSLRRLGRLEEAQDACERALAVEPGAGAAHAVAAAIALDNGDFYPAQQRIDTALELAPGEPYILLVRAEIVLKTQPLENPRAAMEEALSSVRSNPFAFYRADIRRLEQALSEFDRAAPIPETAVPVA